MAISLVQATSQNSTGTAGTTGRATIVFDSNNAAGNLLTLGFYSQSSNFTSTVTDSAGNTWVNTIHSTSAQTETMDVWHCLSAISGSNTVIVEWNNPSANTNQGHLAEWNSAGTWSVASTTASSGASTVASPGSVSPSPSTVVCVAWYGMNSAYAPTSTPTGFSSVGFVLSRSESWAKTVTSTTTENPALTFNATENWKAAMAAFASTSGAAGNTPIRRRHLATMGVG